MTDQSRVEAVKAALTLAFDRGLAPYSDRFAQAAIEANDAWLKDANPRLAAALNLLYEESDR